MNKRTTVFLSSVCTVVVGLLIACLHFETVVRSGGGAITTALLSYIVGTLLVPIFFSLYDSDERKKIIKTVMQDEDGYFKACMGFCFSFLVVLQLGLLIAFAVTWNNADTSAPNHIFRNLAFAIAATGFFGGTTLALWKVAAADVEEDVEPTPTKLSPDIKECDATMSTDALNAQQ